MGSWESTSQAQNSSSASPALPSLLHPAHSSACSDWGPDAGVHMCTMTGVMCDSVLWQLLPAGINTLCQTEAGPKEAGALPWQAPWPHTQVAWLSSTEPCLPERLILPLPSPSRCQCFRLALAFPAVSSPWPLTGSTQLIKFVWSCFIFRGVFMLTIPFPSTLQDTAPQGKQILSSAESPEGFFHWPKLNSRFALTSEFTPRTFKSC